MTIKMRIRLSILVQYAVLIFIVFISSVVYAAALGAIIPSSSDLTWPLIFNGLAPGAILAFFGNRYLNKQDKTNKELIDSKNDHQARIGGIEMIHKLKGCDLPDTMMRGRRKEDR